MEVRNRYVAVHWHTTGTGVLTSVAQPITNQYRDICYSDHIIFVHRFEPVETCVRNILGGLLYETNTKI